VQPEADMTIMEIKSLAPNTNTLKS